MEELSKRVTAVIAEQLMVSTEEVTPKTTTNDLRMDSLDEIEIVMALETEFNIRLEDDLMENCKTVQDVINTIEPLVAANTAH